MRNFLPSAKTKAAIKTKQKELFDSVFSYENFRGSSLTYFPAFVVLYLKLFENIDQMSESTNVSCYSHCNES